MATTDKLGNFRLDSMLLFGKSRILFSDIRGKKSQFIDVSMAPDSLSRTFSSPILPPFKGVDFFAGTTQQKWILTMMPFKRRLV